MFPIVYQLIELALYYSYHSYRRQQLKGPLGNENHQDRVVRQDVRWLA